MTYCLIHVNVLKVKENSEEDVLQQNISFLFPFVGGPRCADFRRVRGFIWAGAAGAGGFPDAAGFSREMAVAHRVTG